MARYFAGNTLAAFSRNNTAPVEVSTAGSFDSTYVANSIQLNTNAGGYIQSAPFSATGTVWLHFDKYFGTTDVSNQKSSTGPMLWNNTLGVGVFRLAALADFSSLVQPQYWNGSAWTNTGTAIVLASNARAQVDVKVVLGASFELYVDGVLQTSGTSWAGSPPTTVTHFRGYGWGNGTGTGQTYLSQILVADFDTRSSKYFCRLATANGTHTDGTGTFTDINEAVLDDATSINLPIVGNRKSFTKSSISVPAGYAISAMVIAGRATVASPASDGKANIRSGGTTYASAGLGLTAGIEPFNYMATTDPATGSAWTQAGFNSAEFGIEAA